MRAELAATTSEADGRPSTVGTSGTDGRNFDVSSLTDETRDTVRSSACLTASTTWSPTVSVSSVYVGMVGMSSWGESGDSGG